MYGSANFGTKMAAQQGRFAFENIEGVEMTRKHGVYSNGHIDVTFWVGESGHVLLFRSGSDGRPTDDYMNQIN